MPEPITKEYFDDKIDGLARSVDDKIDGLARSVAQGFTEVHEHIGELDGRLTARIDEMDTRLSSRMDNLYTTIDGFIQLHRKLEQELVMVLSRCDRLEERLEHLEKRFAAT